MHDNTPASSDFAFGRPGISPRWTQRRPLLVGHANVEEVSAKTGGDRRTVLERFATRRSSGLRCNAGKAGITKLRYE